jgi:hypothetical protein
LFYCRGIRLGWRYISPIDFWTGTWQRSEGDADRGVGGPSSAGPSQWSRRRPAVAAVAGQNKGNCVAGGEWWRGRRFDGRADQIYGGFYISTRKQQKDCRWREKKGSEATRVYVRVQSNATEEEHARERGLKLSLHLHDMTNRSDLIIIYVMIDDA